MLATRGFNAPGQYVGRGGRGAGEDRGLLNAPPSARIPHQLGPPCAFQLRGDLKARATVLTLALCFVGVAVCFAADAFVGTWKLRATSAPGG